MKECPGVAINSRYTIANPNRIVPVRSKKTIKGERLEHELPPYSIHVLEIDMK